MSTMSRTVLALGLALGASAAKNSIVAPTGAETLTVALLGDYGWTGWQPLPLDFCNIATPKLQAAGVEITRAMQNDCDAGDCQAISNATIEETRTARYIEKVCLQKNCSAFISVGDNFYDSGVDFTSEGIQRFYEGWADMYVGEAFDGNPWYQALGNHDVVAGKAGDNSSVYSTDYVISCHKDTNKQVDFLRKSFAESDATWKILQIHHGYISSSSNYTELQPLIDIVRENNGVVVNGHDHCMAHYQYQGMDFVLTGGAGYAEAGDCNYGVPLGPYAKWLGADAMQAANGFVTLDISYESLNFEYYARDMKLKGADYYPVKKDMKPSYNFTVTKHAAKGNH
ncbi:hypothetical protein N7456_008086 [Penicillium angulare]|uniref:Calcineurin-like phosphoesterase domain-containing protein n=1 Tax=Penicillium angulare TaxID=116970 RepID=A0A9W9K906_9EURO|nr:hypothetical protein N7456_008086 [Penicillium angulare]